MIMTQQATKVFPPWDVEHWKDVDDRVRGGASQSHLESVSVSVKGGKEQAARFWGHLGEYSYNRRTLFAV